MELIRKIALKTCLVLVLGVIPAIFSLAEIVAQQSYVVRGKVSDKFNEPIASVTVQVKGTAIGTFTNNDGIYTIEIPDTPDPLLVFSFIGMKTMEVPVNGRSVIDITLDEDLIGLAEVIMVGYATTKKANIVGAVSSVKTDEIASKPVGSLTQSLTGTIPGLIVRDEGGVPGSTSGTFQIRRLGSPLVIVDGMEQSFSYMDPNEIESVTVLKDASAAIYGARAGNGVILVTTRRGSEKKQEFNVSATQTMSRPTVFPALSDAATYAILKNEGNLSAGLAPRYTEEEIEK
ncbi:MAG: TonB-dependent receptor plug domain-containing protein, partial [Bacteroidales bacterium]|nr:TonB-dependent receptor plug domain-containing protein [Bacteroidales bacterium]